MPERPQLDGNSAADILAYLEAACVHTKKSLTTLARLAGVHPSTLNKFKRNPETAYKIKTDTLDKIRLVVDVLDGHNGTVPVDIGKTQAQRAAESITFSHVTKLVGVCVRARLAAGVWQDCTMEWPRNRQYVAPMALRGVRNPTEIYGYEVGDESASDAYPAGSILAALPIKFLRRALRSGERVIIRRRQTSRPDSLVEGTVRELMIDAAGKGFLCSLASRTLRPDLHTTIPCPIKGKRSDVDIIAVVVGSFQPEPAFLKL